MKTSFLNRISLGLILALTGLQVSSVTFYNGKVTGIIRDAETNEPIPSATVAILRAEDNALIRTVSTNADGSFAVDKVPFGKYKVTTTVLGFRQHNPAFVVNGVTTRIAMGNVALQPVYASQFRKDAHMKAEAVAAKAPVATRQGS